jgi:hypothetical protein
MSKNIGKADRILRLCLSLLLFLFAWWQSSWLVLGIALFVLYEALAGWCLFYQLIGKNSCPKPNDKSM